MKRPRFLALAPAVALTTAFWLLAPTALAGAGDAVPGKPEGIKAMYDALKKIELDGSRSVKVENLQVGHDAMDITFVSGRLFFSKPWKEGESPTGAIFVGEGRAKFTPVNKLELHQFKKAYDDKESLDETFHRAFIRFNDGLYDSLKDRLAEDRVEPEVKELFEKRQKALEELLFDAEFPIIEDRLSPMKRYGGRLVEFETDKEGWLSYGHNPQSVEENTLFRHKRVGFGDFQTPSVLSIWYDREDYARGADLDKEDKDLIRIEHYDADFTVRKEGLLLDAKVRVDLTALVNQLAAARFDFVTYYDFAGKQKEFKISSITLPDGTPLDYIHSNYQLLVQFDKPAMKGEAKSIVVSYTADFIRPNPSIGGASGNVPLSFDALDSASSTFTLLNTFPWFPQYGFLKRYSFDWRIKVPKQYKAIGSGVTVKRWEEGDYNCVHKVETNKVALASWLFGRYEIYTDEKDTKRPKIFIACLPKQQKTQQKLYQEARNVVNWYEQWSNTFPYDELDIAQMGFFYGFGQAPPGLVQLTGEAFLSDGEINNFINMMSASAEGGRASRLRPSFIHAFVAHEVGHQWFGHVVSWTSYHDQWLSESFTEYMSGLYVGNLMGQKAFDEKLKQWREYAQQVPDGGSIWLGQRNGKWYTDVTYNKGPYVLHMLRLNMEAQFGVEAGDTMFFNTMKAFLDKFRHQNASTNDLVQVINQTTKKDYSSFFQQWFHDIGIPQMQFTYSVRPTEDGKYVVSIKAVQTDKDNLKQIMLPIGLHFGEKTIVKMMAITQAENTFQIKVPSPPDKVIANEEDGVLAKVKIEKI